MRTILAFLASILVTLAILSAYVLSMDLTTKWTVITMVVVTTFGIGGFVIFGLPGYIILRRLDIVGFWVAPLFGFLISVLVIILFNVFFILSLGEGFGAVWSAFTDLKILGGSLWPAGTIGIIAGTVFWIVDRPDRRLARKALRPNCQSDGLGNP